jgi:hypothetical protein
MHMTSKTRFQPSIGSDAAIRAPPQAVAPVLARNPPEVAAEALLRRAESTSDRELTVEEADAFAMAQVASNEVVIGVGEGAGGGLKIYAQLPKLTSLS